VLKRNTDATGKPNEALVAAAADPTEELVLQWVHPVSDLENTAAAVGRARKLG